MISSTNNQTALVLTCSRRAAKVLSHTGEILEAKIDSKISSLVAGDQVVSEARHEHNCIVTCLPRKNRLFRSYANKTKEIAANLDRVYLIVAPEGLFNTEFVDRVLCTCAIESIPVCVCLNKADLDLTESLPLLELYKNLGYETITCSNLKLDGLTTLKDSLENTDNQIIALVGMSGVGKSSILNQLVPDAKRHTQVVSHKTGKGQQTTSQAQGFSYSKKDNSALLIIDLPGIQNFGTAALPLAQIANSFPEFEKLKSACEFSDCRHLDEPKCAVKNAMQAGHVAPSRYDSYLSIVREIEAFRPY